MVGDKWRRRIDPLLDAHPEAVRNFPALRQLRKDAAMTIDDLDAEISYLMEQLEGEPGDTHEIFFHLKQILDTFRAEGMPVPKTLAKLEADLDAQFRKDAEDKDAGE